MNKLLDDIPWTEDELTETYIPDCDLCSACGEHAEFYAASGESNCCGAKPYNTDYDTEYDR